MNSNEWRAFWSTIVPDDLLRALRAAPRVASRWRRGEVDHYEGPFVHWSRFDTRGIEVALAETYNESP
jgi:hypothetical protein